jgi:prepilin-type N-terminal cleavage/methylation domain-containing protein
LRARGFTLVEMAVVCIIVGVLALLAVVGYR